MSYLVKGHTFGDVIVQRYIIYIYHYYFCLTT